MIMELMHLLPVMEALSSQELQKVMEIQRYW